jgi:hypothetical protein
MRNSPKQKTRLTPRQAYEQALEKACEHALTLKCLIDRYGVESVQRLLEQASATRNAERFPLVMAFATDSLHMRHIATGKTIALTHPLPDNAIGKATDMLGHVFDLWVN